MKGSIQQTKTDRHIPYYSISNTITTYTMYTRPQSIPVYTSKGRQYGRKTLCYLYNIDKQIGNQVHRSQDRMLKKSETKMNLSEYRGKKGLQVLTYKLTYTISWVTGYGKLKLQKKIALCLSARENNGTSADFNRLFEMSSSPRATASKQKNAE